MEFNGKWDQLHRPSNDKIKTDFLEIHPRCVVWRFRQKIAVFFKVQKGVYELYLVLYTRYPIVARALGIASARASKGILHTIFGVEQTCINKFKTYCRLRHYDLHQKLANQYLIKKKLIMTVYNLYVYHYSNKTLKIMKYITRINLYARYLCSRAHLA